MNAGAGGVEIKDIITDVCGFRGDGSSWCAQTDEISWSYRNTSIPEDVIVTAAICQLKTADATKKKSVLKSSLPGVENISRKGGVPVAYFAIRPPESVPENLLMKPAVAE